ncbi:tRNA-dihydrouridine synthase A domain protein, partial [Neisseria meningitidis 992008]
MFELKECENLMINKELIEHKGKRRLCVAPMLDW